MQKRPALALGAAVVGLALITTGLLYVIALSSLGTHGPNERGYQALLAANHLVVVDAVAVAALGLVVASSSGARIVVTGLLVAAGTTFVVGAGAKAVGEALAAIDPTRQPVELNSLLLALRGSGEDVLPAWLVLALAAVVGLASIPIRRRRANGRTTVET